MTLRLQALFLKAVAFRIAREGSGFLVEVGGIQYREDKGLIQDLQVIDRGGMIALYGGSKPGKAVSRTVSVQNSS